MADSRKLTGYPWHIEYLKKVQEIKKNKRRCIHFFKDDSNKQGNCHLGYGICVGTDECNYYKEKPKKIKKSADKKNKKKVISSSPKKETCSAISLNTGDKVTHKKFGFGTILEIKNNCLTIQFENSEYGEKIIRADHFSVCKI